MTKRTLTDEEKALLAAVMEDVRPLVKTPRAPTVVRKSLKKTSPVHHSPLILSSTLDLHGLTLTRAHAQLVAFVEAHVRAGSRNILIVTGKGKGGEGALQHEVPRWLTLSDMKIHVSMVSKASPRRGGEGALCVRLKWKKK